MEIKLALPPPSPQNPKITPPPPKTRNFVGMAVFTCRKNQKSQAHIKLAQPFSALESPFSFFLKIGQFWYTSNLEDVVRSRQRSGEGVMRRNGCPKGCFWRVRSFSAPLRFARATHEKLKGAEKSGLSKNTLLDKSFSARRLLRSST